MLPEKCEYYKISYCICVCIKASCYRTPQLIGVKKNKKKNCDVNQSSFYTAGRRRKEGANNLDDRTELPHQKHTIYSKIT